MDLERIASLLRKALMIAGGAALLALTLLATGNVLLRIFGVPFSGTYEIVAFLGAIVIASALGYTQREKNHIVVDILSDRFPPSVKRVLDGASYAVTTVLFALVTWQVFIWGDRIRASGEMSETLKIPFHPFVYVVALGFAVLALTTFLDLLETLYGESRRRRTHGEEKR